MWSLPQAWEAGDLGSLEVGWLLWWVRMRLFPAAVTGISSSVSSELVNWKKLAFPSSHSGALHGVSISSPNDEASAHKLLGEAPVTKSNLCLY